MYLSHPWGRIYSKICTSSVANVDFITIPRLQRHAAIVKWQCADTAGPFSFREIISKTSLICHTGCVAEIMSITTSPGTTPPLCSTIKRLLIHISSQAFNSMYWFFFHRFQICVCVCLTAFYGRTVELDWTEIAKLNRGNKESKNKESVCAFMWSWFWVT